MKCKETANKILMRTRIRFHILNPDAAIPQPGERARHLNGPAFACVAGREGRRLELKSCFIAYLLQCSCLDFMRVLINVTG
jgi:hypothetical protein